MSNGHLIAAVILINALLGPTPISWLCWQSIVRSLSVSVTEENEPRRASYLVVHRG